jgi:hypothetical protein
VIVVRTHWSSLQTITFFQVTEMIRKDFNATVAHVARRGISAAVICKKSLVYITPYANSVETMQADSALGISNKRNVVET